MIRNQLNHIRLPASPFWDCMDAYIFMNTYFISGASRGIGLELCRQLLTRGDKVIAGCRNPESAHLLSELQKTNECLQIAQLDVDDEQSVINCFENLNNEGATIDRLFNNAGIIDWRDLHEVSADSFSRVLQTNLRGAFLVLSNALPCLKRSEDAWIYNMSSRLGSIKLRGNTQLGGAIAYECSKAGLNMLTKQASIDLADSGIQVVSLSPGWVKTEMGGEDAKYDVEDSVNKILTVTDKLTPSQSGGFWGEDEKEIPW
jgi:NAD(P)-dependent dehydrogenase (short-subunit alcohol dehydrogenase family)